MVDDLRIIKSLEKQLGVNLDEVDFEASHHIDLNAVYSMSGGRVTGLVLDSLYESGSRLESIPELVFELSELVFLRLAWNHIIDIDPRIAELQKLEYLNLFDNEIRQIPREIALGPLELKRVDSFGFYKGCLNIERNPIETPPIEIIDKGRAAIEDYFASIAKQARPLHEVKALFIGQGGAGKTSLIRRLLGRKFNPKESTTHGIRIEKWKPTHKGTKIKVNIWDFGGQEMMHSTHQFFLSKRSLYVVVLDGRREEDPEYWLSYVLSFGGHSSILVVLNKIDENPGFDVDRKFLKDKYPSIIGFSPISCATGEGIRKFRSLLRESLAGLDHITTTWGESWFNVKTKLERLRKDYISYDAFVEICTEQGIEEDGQRVLVDFLNDLGVIVHFNDPLLRETNVIRPDWITSAVYVIVTSDKLAEAKGILPTTTISRMLSARRYPKHKHDYILELMQKFELCFFLDETSTTLLVPALLPKNQPDFELDLNSALAFVFEYDFLPPAIIHKLMVKMNRIIHNDLYWRKGVVLLDPDFNCEAMLRVDERDKRIQVFINGDRRRDFFAVIYKALSDIHKGFASLGYRELVPLPGHPSHFVDYQSLLGYEEMGVEEYVEGRLRERFLVKELLNGIERERYRTGKRWDAFISHASQDRAAISEFLAMLKRHGVRYWIDEEQVLPGDAILSKIEDGLERSNALLTFFSRNQLESSWCRREYEAVLADVFSKRAEKRVIPIVLDDVAIDNLPITLRSVRAVDFGQAEQVEKLVDLLAE